MVSAYSYVKESDKISEAEDSNKSESEAAPLRRGRARHIDTSPAY